MTTAVQTELVPLLPSRTRILLPGLTTRMKIGRPSSVKLVEEQVLEKLAAKSGGVVLIGIIPLKPDARATNPTALEQATDLHQSGCLARVLRVEKLNEPEARYTLVLEGVSRVKLVTVTQQQPYFVASVQRVAEPVFDKKDNELDTLQANLRQVSRDLVELLKSLRLPQPVVAQMRKYMENMPPGQLADLLTTLADASPEEQVDVLDTLDLKVRLAKVIAMVKRQIQVLKISQEVQTTVEGKLNKKQREAYLRQQLKAIKEELNESTKDDDEQEDEAAELQKRLDEAQLPEEPEKAAQRELRRMKRMHPSQAEYAVIRNYLEWLAEIPWNTSSPSSVDVDKARAQLEHDHFGLEKVKKRILEYLAVRQLKQDMRGPILCFIGPPGVGKTSLGHSIADALGRKFHRISLGGVRDEAEIRGHRRTYIGAMPGRIVQGLKKTAVNNPVLLLDEIDKLGRDVRGDPASALLEVLDAEQNGTFMDHYLNVPLDLSKVLFIATANEADTIPPPLLDRMEIIRLPGYTFDEKREIARRHLLPKQLKAHGLAPNQLEIDDNVLHRIAVSYTREAGVRTLEREIATMCRSVAVQCAQDKKNGTEPSVRKITTPDLEAILGPEPFENDVLDRTSTPGVATGLFWTANGAGGILFIEATKMPGTGRLILTGMLGDVIKESAQAALSWVRSNAYALGLSSGNLSAPSLLDKTDIHIHFPEGAMPKDGPSAGVTIVTALVSLLTNKTLRPFTAMTGEMTLRGLVLPVGGIKEKVLAAHRAGVKRIILPYRNQKDLVEVPKNVQDDVDFIFAKRISDVLDAAFDASIFHHFDTLPSSHL